jgi:hypothetical protein
MTYKIKDITPREMQCIIAGCPAIYEGLRELTPPEMACLIGGCPSVHEATQDKQEVYLIVGKAVNLAEFGLEGKLGEGKTAIEVPRALINNRRK